jgi:hypothetical protein
MKLLNVCLILFCIIVSLSIYKTVYGAWYDWILGGTREVEITLEEPKTLDSEVDRLSIKYGVASSTVRSIIYCESRMYGSVVNVNYENGIPWSEDRGYMQINDYYHKDTMTKLGLDYYNEFDSLEYGFILLQSQGLTPWNASKGCWSKLI